MGEFNRIDSRKVKLSGEMTSKFEKEARRGDITERILSKRGAKIASIGIEVNFDEPKDFEFTLNNIRNSINLKERENFIAEAEQEIEDCHRSYDRVLSDVSLSSEDRVEIKKNRNALVDNMRRRLAEVINEFEIDDEPEVSDADNVYSVSEVDAAADMKNEEENSMDLEGSIIGDNDLRNMTYVDYLCSVASSDKTSVRTIFETLVNGKSDVNVLTAEQFGGEKRGQVEIENQRIVDDKNKSLESQLIDKNNEIAADLEEIERLKNRDKMSKEQIEQLVENVGVLRDEKRNLEKNVLEQGNTISSLNKRIVDLEGQIRMISSDNSKKQGQILELQVQVRNLNNTIEAANLENRRLSEEHSQYVSEKEVEISGLNAQLRARDRERDNLSAILNGVTSDDDLETPVASSISSQDDFGEEDTYNNQGDMDLDKLSKVSEALKKVMSDAQFYEDDAVRKR